MSEHQPMHEVQGCSLCMLPISPQSFSDSARPLGQGDMYLVPSAGMLTPGHFMTVTSQHFLSYAELGRPQLQQAKRYMDNVAEHLSKWFGRYLFIEHGSGDSGAQELGSQACIEHAHMVLFSDPAGAVGTYLLQQFEWQRLDTFEDLSMLAGDSYLYLGHLSTHWAMPRPAIPGQWFRRQVAAVLGLEDFDWAMPLPSYDDNLRVTLAALSAPPDA